jgi:hypothetical protein
MFIVFNGQIIDVKSSLSGYLLTWPDKSQRIIYFNANEAGVSSEWSFRFNREDMDEPELAEKLGKEIEKVTDPLPRIKVADKIVQPSAGRTIFSIIIKRYRLIVETNG